MGVKSAARIVESVADFLHLDYAVGVGGTCEQSAGMV